LAEVRKKPAVVPGKANEQQQREWITEYEQLREELPEDEAICFTDGVQLKGKFECPFLIKERR